MERTPIHDPCESNGVDDALALVAVPTQDPIILETLLRPITPEHTRRSPADPNEWSIIEILCHLRDYEHIFSQRSTLILQEEEPRLLVPESNDVLATLGQYKQQELRSVLTSLHTTRQTFIQILSALRKEQWMRTGSYNDSFPVTLKEVVLQVIMHDIDHMEQLTPLL
ncbi:hypothetical protein KSD_91580 [Ktedonobacter sp. SOSP1-85]|uniref:DinB family protein n=1 Tax=Ktedonobacter sp. SOSP1-85 TaxID=2778367 RepID=UPI0019167F89|nr:DinB family protein [Ktedonobacter sp. SOSP1-85]GHO81387.1 hypothetical protein KSD_91580 [Ktedonobacter sp. SOSP1-85]